MTHFKTPWQIAIISILVLSSCNLPVGKRQTPPAISKTPSSQSEGQSAATVTPTILPTPTPTAEARIFSGDMALLSGQTEKARSEYINGSAETQDVELQAAAMLGIGRSYLLDREYDLAIDSFNALIFEHPQNRWQPNAYYFLAQAYLAKEEYGQAADALAKYSELNPGVIDDVIQSERGDICKWPGNTRRLQRTRRLLQPVPAVPAGSG